MTENGKTILITGSSGYLGSCLIEVLTNLPWVKNIHGMDVAPPRNKHELFKFSQLDITHAESVSDEMLKIKPDIAIHLAFIVNPIHDEKLMHRINVDGTRYFLDAAEKAVVPKIMVASSGTAYGAWPDNPVPLYESDPIRPHKDFAYARDKAEVESLCDIFCKKNPDVIFSVIRPTVVFGKNVDNYLSDLLLMPIVPKVLGANPYIQLVHEEDVMGSIIRILESDARGGFNIAPADALKLNDIIKKTRSLKLAAPYFLARLAVKVAWNLRLKFQSYPPGFIDYMRFPWVLDNGRLTDELGYEFKFSTEETLSVLLQQK